MKHSLGISTLSVICVMCAAVASNAHAAASVRSLGGAGTYSSASAASTAGVSSSGTAGSAISAARGGSMRVSPTSNKGGTVAQPTGSVASTPRLSIGKYLGSGTSVSGGSSVRPGGSTGGSSGSTGGTVDPGAMAEISRQIDDLYKQVDRLGDANDVLSDELAKKQDPLKTGDGYVYVENDEVFVNVDELKNALDIVEGQDGREVIIGSNDTDLLWKYDGDASWQVLISKDELVGPQGPRGEKGEPGTAADMGLYSTTLEMNAAIDGAIKAAAADYAKMSDLANLASKDDVKTSFDEITKDINAALDDKADSVDVYTKTQVDQNIADAVAGVVAGDMTEALKGYAKKTELDAYAKSENVNAALGGKANVGDSYTKVEADALLGDKADKSQLDNYATTASLSGKADAADLEALESTVISVGNSAAAAKNAADSAAAAANAATVALADKANKSDIPVVPTKVSAFQNDAGYLTQHQSLDGYATKEELGNYATTTVLNETKTELKNEIQQVVAGDVTNVINNAVTEQLAEIQITNNQVADDAEIARTKLAADVRTSLDKADSIEEVPKESGDYVLFVSNGKKEWAKVVGADGK